MSDPGPRCPSAARGTPTGTGDESDLCPSPASARRPRTKTNIKEEKTDVKLGALDTGAEVGAGALPNRAREVRVHIKIEEDPDQETQETKADPEAKFQKRAREAKPKLEECKTKRDRDDQMEREKEVPKENALEMKAPLSKKFKAEPLSQKKEQSQDEDEGSLGSASLAQELKREFKAEKHEKKEEEQDGDVNDQIESSMDASEPESDTSLETTDDEINEPPDEAEEEAIRAPPPAPAPQRETSPPTESSSEEEDNDGASLRQREENYRRTFLEGMHNPFAKENLLRAKELGPPGEVSPDLYRVLTKDDPKAKRYFPFGNDTNESVFAGGVECLQCGKVLAEMGSIRYHIRSVHNHERRFKCPICKNKYPTRHYIDNEHLPAMHGRIARHVCPMCNTSYRWSSSLSTHMSAKVATAFNCETCGKAFQADDRRCYSKQHVLHCRVGTNEEDDNNVSGNEYDE